MSKHPKPLLEVKELTFESGGRRILDRVSISVWAGEVHAILGTNGTGKSTLAYVIIGCDGYKPTSGAILFEGRDIGELKIYDRARLGITMAWQEPVRFEGISVREYLTLRNRELDPSHYLELVGLKPEHYLERMVDKSLSGGERKRIELASVLSLNPRLAILDEPDSGIDMLSMGDIISVIDAFRDNGASVLLITHREEVARIADRASLMCGGKVVYSGPPDIVTDYYKSRRCVVCDWTDCMDVRAQ
ncbi:MAG: ABC transporter ATP-binding protein [Candidatus Methanosuratincola sp.]|jgi:Fe-S cluster assembly ATP-binding protein